MTVTFHGFNTHPGYAQGTHGERHQGRGGLHRCAALPTACRLKRPTGATDTSTRTSSTRAWSGPPVKLLIRDFETAGLREKEALLERLAREAVARYPGSRVEIAVAESYRNMKEILDRHPRRRRARTRGDPPRRARSPRHADSRRHGRLAAVVHGAADAKPLRRRAQLPLAARVGIGAGHGEGGAGDRGAVQGVGRRRESRRGLKLEV